MRSQTLFFKLFYNPYCITKKYYIGRQQEVVEENGLLTERYYNEWKQEMDKQEELQNAVTSYGGNLYDSTATPRN